LTTLGSQSRFRTSFVVSYCTDGDALGTESKLVQGLIDGEESFTVCVVWLISEQTSIKDGMSYLVLILGHLSRGNTKKSAIPWKL
jgi:hypothetical protein